MMNSLKGELSLKVGPLVLEVLVRHWFNRLKKECSTGENEDPVDVGARLKEDDILYHEAFVIVKSFLNAATSHTIEEIQGFANTRTPSPPWVHVVRTRVPLPCCDEAASHLIEALGGEDVARQVIGGVKWWQVRGIDGIDAQWLTMKKDWQKAKKRHKMQQQTRLGVDSVSISRSESEEGGRMDSGVYDKDMDAMRCILYLHGGGYYFGSVDQTRYSTQRHARKINGRVFAINYRLAPQYPFPCGLHDALAAYLFLIRPPSGSDHEAVNPAHIIISGDSAGGGLALALLQVIRDAHLPLPAGGVLISPWCDLTHSFPSVHQNTKKDFIPESGLSFHKPSTLWPPPSPAILKSVHASLRFRIKQAFRLDDPAGRISQTSTAISEKDMSHRSLSDSPSHSAGLNSKEREKVVMKLSTGEDVEIKEQLQFYTVNSLLNHPYVSPVAGYLGGLPPLLFIAGDEEVLRDEIIYTAHKAAYPKKYPIQPRTRLLCPHIEDVEKRYKKSTSVHLQVYDGAPHDLPVIFPFTTPAKFCFRAIATFDRFVTDMKVMPPMTLTSRSNSSWGRPSILHRKSLFSSFYPRPEVDETILPILDDAPVLSSPPRMDSEAFISMSPSSSLSRDTVSSKISQAGISLRRNQTYPLQTCTHDRSRAPLMTTDSKQESSSSSDVFGPEFQSSQPTVGDGSPRTAGDPQVYEGIKDLFNWECGMIRERVSTAGITRQLESEDDLAACKIPISHVAQLSEASVVRFLKTQRRFDQQFEHTIKSIEKSRRRNLSKAKEDTIKRVTVLQQSFQKRADTMEEEDRSDTKIQMLDLRATQSRVKFDQRVLSSPGWAWSWALDEMENPPPSSIVARRDTEEARQLAAVADWATQDDHVHVMSGNHLWNIIQNFLTPGDGNMKPHGKAPSRDGQVPAADTSSPAKNQKKTVNGHAVSRDEKRTSIFAKTSGFLSKS